MECKDICFAPVLSMWEAPNHPHNVARKTFIELEGLSQPAPAPRFSRTEVEVSSPPSIAGEHTDSILKDLGYDETEISSLKNQGGVA